MKNRFIFRFCFLFLTILCTTHNYGQKKAKLTTEEKAVIKNSKILVVRYEAPPLSFMTPKDAAGEGLIAKATQSDIVDKRERHRYYPSARLQKTVDSLFRAEGLFTEVEIKDEAYEFMMPSELKKLDRHKDVDADYILEIIVPLMGWRATYGATKWRTYHLNLGVEVRLIRKSDMAMVWKNNTGYGGYNDKAMRFHITELETGGADLIDSKLNVMVLQSGRKLVENYVKAKK
ncbi:MAG: hypothetical protein ABF293_01475 [Flavobacteriaceae bacterium]